jgi:predicted lysophospholipase L1 biosynthesis ABC-type transport system permease subunit
MMDIIYFLILLSLLGLLVVAIKKSKLTQVLIGIPLVALLIHYVVLYVLGD